ncbi:hypothetical protein PUR57_35035 [Streptomyces sp. JV176]|uniref:hypothetical protein n=1 Tax=Streptomyces sp. JV176 TaxID=858630 RepID=UPI002E77C32E|nr:hypothetical protein [Streptomyces sp. JV176]MEE1803827.1 hypothetical protein [Streptomyces sp. JV176]
MQHLLTVGSLFLLSWGITCLVEVFNLFREGCGPRFGNSCEGRGAIGAGASGVVLGILAVDRVSKRKGWTGPLGGVMIVPFMVGPTASAVAFATNALSVRDTGTAVMHGVWALLLAGVSLFLLRDVVKAIREDPRGYFRDLFWVLEELPDSTSKRKRLLRERGISPDRVNERRLVPETRQEKAHWLLFLVDSAVGLAGGMAGALLFIARVG